MWVEKNPPCPLEKGEELSFFPQIPVSFLIFPAFFKQFLAGFFRPTSPFIPAWKRREMTPFFDQKKIKKNFLTKNTHIPAFFWSKKGVFCGLPPTKMGVRPPSFPTSPPFLAYFPTFPAFLKIIYEREFDFLRFFRVFFDFGGQKWPPKWPPRLGRPGVAH